MFPFDNNPAIAACELSELVKHSETAADGCRNCSAGHSQFEERPKTENKAGTPNDINNGYGRRSTLTKKNRSAAIRPIIVSTVSLRSFNRCS